MNKKQAWKKKFDYHDYEYLRIPKAEWEEWEKRFRDGKYVNISFKKLMSFKIDYDWKIENKQKSANNASKIRKARSDMKIFKTLENYFTGLFKEDKDITKYSLAKDSGVSYPKVKKFWEEHNLDYWIERFKKDSKNLKKFLYQELAESIIWNK